MIISKKLKLEEISMAFSLKYSIYVFIYYPNIDHVFLKGIFKANDNLKLNTINIACLCLYADASFCKFS